MLAATRDSAAICLSYSILEAGFSNVVWACLRSLATSCADSGFDFVSEAFQAAAVVFKARLISSAFAFVETLSKR